MVTITNVDGWRIQETKTDRGHIYEMQAQITLSGAAQTLDASVGFPFELNRIEYFSDDATAKSFTERIYSGGIDPASYDQIVNVAADTNQALAYYPSGSEGTYTQSPIKISTVISASTAGKLLTKKIIIRRI